MSIKQRLDRIERAAPRPRQGPAALDADALAAGMAAWVEDSRDHDTPDGRSARAFVEALAALDLDVQT